MAARRLGQKYISGGALDDTLRELDGNDTLKRRGGADPLIGGSKDDAASYLHAAAEVTASQMIDSPTICAESPGNPRGDISHCIEKRKARHLVTGAMLQLLLDSEGKLKSRVRCSSLRTHYRSWILSARPASPTFAGSIQLSTPAASARREAGDGMCRMVKT
jgi:hypothetical protein